MDRTFTLDAKNTQRNKYLLKLEKFDYLKEHGVLNKLYFKDELFSYVWVSSENNIPFLLDFADGLFEIGIISNGGNIEESPRFIVFEIFKINTKGQRNGAIRNIESVVSKSFDELFEDNDWVCDVTEYQEKFYEWICAQGYNLH